MIFVKMGFGSKLKPQDWNPQKHVINTWKTLNYLLMVIDELAESKIKSKWNLKLALKTMFFGWTWRK